MEIFVMGFGETAAPGARFFEGRRMVGDAVVRREGGPSLLDQFVVCDVDRHGQERDVPLRAKALFYGFCFRSARADIILPSKPRPMAGRLL